MLNGLIWLEPALKIILEVWRDKQVPHSLM